MPRAKRLKSSGPATTRPEVKQPPPPPPPELSPSLVVEDDNEFAQLARKYWLKPSKKKSAAVKIKNDALRKEFWEPLVEQKFAYKSLLVLENLQALER